MTRTATPTTFTFDFIAEDGNTYPVTVEFLKRLPALTLVGMSGTATRDFRNRAGLMLHTVLPRMRVVVTVDDSAIERPLGPLETADRQRSIALHRSGAALADQLFIALQARRF